MHQRTLAAFRELGEMTPGSCWLGALTALASFPAIASVSAEVLGKPSTSTETHHTARSTSYSSPPPVLGTLKNADSQASPAFPWEM